MIFYAQDKQYCLHYLKGKDHKNTNEFCLKVFGKLHTLTQTAWKSDSYLRRYRDFMFYKWLPTAAILKETLEPKIIKLNLFLKTMHTYTHLTKVIFVCYVNTQFIGLFYEYCTLKKKKKKKKKNTRYPV